jgi:hypothetical protein
MNSTTILGRSIRHVPLRMFRLFFLAAMAAAWGVRNVYYYNSSFLGVIVPFGVGLDLALWCLADARNRGQELPRIAGFCLFAFYPVSVPAYMYWTQGFRGLGLAVAIGLGTWLLAIVTMIVVGLVLFGPGWLVRF